jgi:hypothetical protein
MHDQRNDPTPAEQEVHDDTTVLNLLLEDGLRAPLSVDEVIHEVGRRINALDALTRLQGAGLIHRCDEFVFATRAARRSQELRAF